MLLPSIPALIEYYAQHSLVEHFKAMDTPLIHPCGNQGLSSLLTLSHTASEFYPPRRRVKALFSFRAAADDELTFLAGEEFTLVTTDGCGDGWWRGEHDGKTGLFPSAYVQVL
jgi:hypothetical protein